MKPKSIKSVLVVCTALSAICYDMNAQFIVHVNSKACSSCFTTLAETLCSLNQRFSVVTMPLSPVLFSVYKQLVARRVSSCADYTPHRSVKKFSFDKNLKCPFLTWSYQGTGKDSLVLFAYDDLFDSKGRLRASAENQLRLLAAD